MATKTAKRKKIIEPEDLKEPMMSPIRFKNKKDEEEFFAKIAEIKAKSAVKKN